MVEALGELVDYAWTHPAPTEVTAAGYEGVMRYFSPYDDPDKNLTADELSSLRAAGLWVGVVWESTETRPREGWDAGVADAVRCIAMADELGLPDWLTLYYAVDRSDTTFGQVEAYFRGVDSVGGVRARGVYGNKEVIDGVCGSGLATKGWQVETWVPDTDWTHNPDGTWTPMWSRFAVLVQMANEASRIPATDLNYILAPDWGGWAPPGVPRPRLGSWGGLFVPVLVH